MRFSLRSVFAALAVTSGLIVAAIGAASAQESKSLTIFAAASMKDVLDQAAERFAEAGKRVVLSYAGSGILARQIERGAPADMFVNP